MASFQRLVFLLLFVSCNAIAATYTAPITYVNMQFNTGVVFTNLDTACRAVVNSPTNNYSFGLVSLDTCELVGTTVHSVFHYYSNAAKTSIGAKDTNVGSAVQTCVAPDTDVAGTNFPNHLCNVVTPPCVAGQNVSSGTYANGSSPLTPFPNVVCAGGCTATFTGVWPDSRSCVNDSCTYYAKGSYDKNGQACTGGASLPAPVLSVPMSPEQAALKALEAERQAQFDAALAAKRAEDAAFNAALKAAAGTSAADAAAKKLAADAAAQKAATAASDAKAAAAKAAADAAAADAVNNDPNATQAQKDAANGISSVSGAASAAAGAAATAAAGTANTAAATAAAAAGNAAADAKATEKTPDTQLCDKYPNAPACLVHTADAGFCVAGKLAGFKCDGDAITCSQTKAQQEAFCANLQSDGLNDFGTSLINQEKTFTSDVGSMDNPTQIQVGQLNSSSFLTKSCLADLNFVIVGQNIPLPLSKLCTGLEIAGRIVKFFAYMIAARIIFS